MLSQARIASEPPPEKMGHPLDPAPSARTRPPQQVKNEGLQEVAPRSNALPPGLGLIVRHALIIPHAVVVQRRVQMPTKMNTEHSRGVSVMIDTGQGALWRRAGAMELHGWRTRWIFLR